MNRHPRLTIDRRTLLQTAVLSTLAASLPRAWAGSPDLPVGPFGAESTAEEVTRGLDLSGMTIVVTGCNSGLGYETMRVLAMRGAHVIGTARTNEKGERACGSIDGNATPVVLELSDFDSVRACAQTIEEMDTPIDVLMCNAAIMALPELELVRGIERQFVVNHLGHFILVNSLLGTVIKADQGRIVMVSSGAHRFAPKEGIDFDNLDGSQSYEGWAAYGRSKLANGLFAAELARRLEGTSVTANSLHPGVIKTNLGRHLERDDDDDDTGRYNKSIEQGAATQCYVATSPIITDVSGQYFVDCNPADPNPLMYDKALAARLWTVSEELTQPGTLG